MFRLSFPCLTALALLLSLVSPESPAAEPKTIEVKVTEAQARAFVDRWFPAWVGGAPSVERLLAFYAPDATYVDPNRPKGITGHAALRAFFTEMLGNNPNWKFRVVAIYPTRNGFILNWSADIPLPHKTLVDFRGVDVIDLDDRGLITRHEDYFDLSVFRKE